MRQGTGKRYRIYETVKGTKKQADFKKQEMIQQFQNGNVASNTNLLLSSWMNTWLTSYNPNIASTTRASYREKIDNYIIPKMGHLQLKNITPLNIQNFINSLIEQGLSSKTIRNTYNILNPALNKAVILKMLPFNPCVGAELPKLVKYQADVYDKEEISRVLNLAKNSDIYLMLVLQFSLGLRRGELDGLLWSDIDLDKKIVHIRRNRVSPKNGDKPLTKLPKSAAGKRSLSIGDNLTEILTNAKKEYQEDKEILGNQFYDLGFVIRQKNGLPYHPDSLTQKWSRFVKKHNLEKIRLHDSRHSHATMLIEDGVSSKVVQSRLGHSDITTTLNTYTHVLPSMDVATANKIDELIFSS